MLIPPGHSIHSAQDGERKNTGSDFGNSNYPSFSTLDSSLPPILTEATYMAHNPTQS